MTVNKTLTIIFGIMLVTFISAPVLAESGLDAATPQAEVKHQEQTSDQTNPNTQSTSGHVSISKRNEAKLKLEKQQRELRQDRINKDKAAEAVSP